ncbi:MAG: flagellar protein export ATPase FliI [bacterium]
MPDSYVGYYDRLAKSKLYRLMGRVVRVTGLVVESTGPDVSVGEACQITTREGKTIAAEVVGFRNENVLLMPLEETVGIHPGSYVSSCSELDSIAVGPDLLGRVLDGMGNPIDGLGALNLRESRPVHNLPPNPLKRARVDSAISTGIRVLDSLLTCGQGQRVGIFAGSGVGKSVLMGMIARTSSASVNVIALIGERGRELRDFIERDLGEEGLKRSVVVAVTSEQAGLLRVKGALVATAIAEYFADQGLDVMLMLDSITRVAMAQREIGLAVGEPPTTKGYTPSVFALLPRLLERAGNFQNGSITGLYTVLVEGDDMNDPIADTVRSILDGHIVLSRKLAAAGHYPSIDVLESVSRVMIDVVSKEHLRNANKVKEILATYRESEDLINIGAYAKGSNPRIDYAIAMIDKVRRFQQQDIDESTGLEKAVDELKQLLASEIVVEEDTGPLKAPARVNV